MNFFTNVTSNVTKAVDFVVEKNRKAALVNRIRIVIKNERENAARSYVSLGKYYFDNLRDAQNEETEALCKSVEVSNQRIKKAFQKLDEITTPEIDDDDACEDCSANCDCCLCYDDSDEAKQNGPLTDDFDLDSSIIDKANDTGTASDEAAKEPDEEAAEDESVIPLL